MRFGKAQVLMWNFNENRLTKGRLQIQETAKAADRSWNPFECDEEYFYSCVSPILSKCLSFVVCRKSEVTLQSEIRRHQYSVKVR